MAGRLEGVGSQRAHYRSTMIGSLSGRSILCDRLVPASTSCNRAVKPSHAATHVSHTSRLQQHRASIEEHRWEMCSTE